MVRGIIIAIPDLLIRNLSERGLGAAGLFIGEVHAEAIAEFNHRGDVDFDRILADVAPLLKRLRMEDVELKIWNHSQPGAAVASPHSRKDRTDDEGNEDGNESKSA